ncbi:purine-cytosine permease [Artomyces pyxidatus]|uniref:Purine-cytosine permease n=1 Tax=Artomyces pyxidatus TaxID=48021 RepID=A0ACB8SL42_9AGAM|nr:purine-cytosine permease [Artomyces pyxidatus]
MEYSEKRVQEHEGGDGQEASSAEAASLSIGSAGIETRFQRFTRLLKTWGVETHGIAPIPLEGRTDKRLYQLFFVWFSANFNVLAFSTGTVGPAFFSLGLRDALYIVLAVDLVLCAVPAYFAVFGPKLGTRAMVQSRFSFGFYGAIIPSTLNAFSLMGFLILNTIVGGQTLAAVSPRLNDTVGIVVIGVISLAVCFMGYRVLHIYESFAWFPNLIAFLVMLGVGAKHIVDIPTPPPEPAAVLSFASIVVSSVLSWCTMTPDYGVYHAPASSWRIFIYVYLGFFVASLPGHMLGVAFAAGAPAVPAWEAGLGGGSNVGGLLGAVLAMAGGFGRFLTVTIALTIPSAVAPTMYSFGTSFMAVTPLFARIPRYVYAIVSTAILIPVAIVGAVRFYNTLVDILSIIGYWSSSFAAIVMADHIVVRRGRWATYNVEDWSTPRRLPLGLAAVGAFVGSIGLIVPCMDQVWYTGPIAASGTGDISMYTAFASAALLYVPLRLAEMQWERRRGRGAPVTDLVEKYTA